MLFHVPKITVAGLLLTLALLAAQPAAAWRVHAGLNSTDVGLHESGTGLTLGLAHQMSPPVSPWALDISLDYVRRAGVQPRYYSDEQTGFFLADAEVKLQYLQPGLLLGRDLSLSGGALRYYAGASLTIKLDESWEEPLADARGDFKYEDTGYLAHLGLAGHFGRFWLDARSSFGLKGQLVDRTGYQGEPASHDPDGVTDYDDGARFIAYQLTVGLDF